MILSELVRVRFLLARRRSSSGPRSWKKFLHPAGVLLSTADRAQAVFRVLPGASPPAQAGFHFALTGAVGRAGGLQTRRIGTGGVRNLLFDAFEHPRCEKVSAPCLACANCTMVCPTCFRIAVEDTSGGSVRLSGKSRCRQWLTHKLAAWIGQFGASGCAGCGRCITWCPVGIDISGEVAAKHANALHSQLRERGYCFVGPLARQAAEDVGLAVKLVFACEEALRLIAEYEPPAAPRRLLYHRCVLDGHGLIMGSKCVPPTSQNQKRMEHGLWRFVPQVIHRPIQEITRVCERAIRNYEPCISRATHFLRLNIERVSGPGMPRSCVIGCGNPDRRRCRRLPPCFKAGPAPKMSYWWMVWRGALPPGRFTHGTSSISLFRAMSSAVRPTRRVWHKPLNWRGSSTGFRTCSDSA